MLSDVAKGVWLYSIDKEGVLDNVSAYESWGWVEDTVIYGNRLYVKDSGGYLEVVDLRTPESPRLVDVVAAEGIWEVSGRLGYDFATTLNKETFEFWYVE